MPLVISTTFDRVPLANGTGTGRHFRRTPRHWGLLWLVIEYHWRVVPSWIGISVPGTAGGWYRHRSLSSVPGTAGGWYRHRSLSSVPGTAGGWYRHRLVPSVPGTTHGRRHRGGRGGQVPRYRKLAGYSTPLSSVRLEALSVGVYTML